MEFTLDLELIRGILKQERARCSSDIHSLGVLPALGQSQQRHDARLAQAADAGSLACHAGCSWCCHFTVDVRPAEVLQILDYVEITFAEEAKARVMDEVHANAQLIRPMDQDQRMTRNIRCPFLDQGHCTIYPVRPQTCRNYHATDSAGCRQSYEDPGNLDIDPEFAPAVYQAGAAHVEAVSTAMAAAGFDVNAYELNCALDAALSDPDAHRRFEDGEQPFKGLPGEEVPAEFDDLDT